MFNSSFFPTPTKVANLIVSKIDKVSSKFILEPSAGKGDLADAVMRAISLKKGWGFNKSDHAKKIHCCEIEPDLQAILRDKGYTLVGSDFLTFTPPTHYDTIIMNPPFANADRHLLHAWDILDEGEIFCLLNSETLNNPYSQTRKQLHKLIEDNGEIQDLGACFLNAERKTTVQVSLVTLKKEAKKQYFQFTKKDFEHDDPKNLNYENLNNQIATKNFIGNLVRDYEKCIEIFEKMALLGGELAFHSGRINGGSNISKELIADAMKPLFNGLLDNKAYRSSCNVFSTRLKQNAWDYIFLKTKINNLVSEGVRKDFAKLCRDNRELSFSENNIATFLETLVLNQGNILQQCVIEAFDLMTNYYPNNRLAAEGWKTNDSWRVNRRVILPHMISNYGWETYPTIEFTKRRVLNDIDRALAFLEGLKLSDLDQAITDIFQNNGSKMEFGKEYESKYFKFKCFKKGTMHLYFKDKFLWERFNSVATEGKNWLPEDIKWKEKSAKKGAVVVF